MKTSDLLPLLDAEIDFGRDNYGRYNSAHEQLGVYLEEFEEWKDHVKDNTSDSPEALYELLQGAAVCLRYIKEHGSIDSIAKVQHERHNRT